MLSSHTPLRKLDFQQFIRLSDTKRKKVLGELGVKFDSYTYNGEIVNLYYIDNFFVEEILCASTGHFKELIPYKHGFRVRSNNETIKLFISGSSVSKLNIAS